MLGLLTAGASAAAAIIYLAHKGNTRANWIAICQQYNSFCERISGSLIGSFAGILIFILLILLSAVALSRRWLYTVVHHTLRILCVLLLLSSVVVISPIFLPLPPPPSSHSVCIISFEICCRYFSYFTCFYYFLRFLFSWMVGTHGCGVCRVLQGSKCLWLVLSCFLSMFSELDILISIGHTSGL